MFDYVKKHDFERRKQEAENILAKYPDRIPVIAQVSENSSLERLKKEKFLLPQDLTVGQFIYVLRKRMKLKPEESLFLFINGILPPTSAVMSKVYNDYKSECLYLFCQVNTEEVFGTSS